MRACTAFCEITIKRVQGQILFFAWLHQIEMNLILPHSFPGQASPVPPNDGHCCPVTVTETTAPVQPPWTTSWSGLKRRRSWPKHVSMFPVPFCDCSSVEWTQLAPIDGRAVTYYRVFSTPHSVSSAARNMMTIQHKYSPSSSMPRAERAYDEIINQTGGGVRQYPWR